MFPSKRVCTTQIVKDEEIIGGFLYLSSTWRFICPFFFEVFINTSAWRRRAAKDVKFLFLGLQSYDPLNQRAGDGRTLERWIKWWFGP